MKDWISKRTYIGPAAGFAFHTTSRHRDRIRSEAMWFANRELDPESVLSLSETTAFGGRFSVTVWYRADEEQAETVFMTYADLKSGIGSLSRALADADAKVEVIDEVAARQIC